MAYRSFEELEVWKKSVNLAVEIYTFFRNSKEFGLKDQMLRSSISISSNIAEGSERNSIPDFIRFLHIAKGSSAELKSQLIIAERVGIISTEKAQELSKELTEVSSMVHGLITYLSSKLKK